MRLKVSFEGIEVKPDDTVVIRPEYIIDDELAQRLLDVAKKAFLTDNIIILPDCKINVYNKKEMLEFLENVKKMVEGSTTE